MAAILSQMCKTWESPLSYDDWPSSQYINSDVISHNTSKLQWNEMNCTALWKLLWYLRPKHAEVIDEILWLCMTIVKDLFDIWWRNIEWCFFCTKRCGYVRTRSVVSKIRRMDTLQLCVLRKNNSVAGDRKPRNSCYSAMLKRLIW